MKNTIKRATQAAVVLVIAGMVVGCGGGKQQQAETGGKIQIAYEKLPPGALPDVTAEQGGDGFTGEGWTTNMDYPVVGSSDAKVGGTFTFPLFEFPATLRTIGKDSNSQFMYIVENLVYESLMGIHSETMEFIPGLATHWRISDDKQTFWFRINPNARFSDGSRLTSADVITTWKLQTDPGILAPYSNILWGKFDEPVAESPYIVRVHAKELNWRFFLYFGGMSILPAKYIGQLDGAGYLQEYQFKMPPGSSIYMLDDKDIVKGRALTLKRRPDYWDINNPKSVGSANFDKLRFAVVNDERLTFEKFKKGEFDAYQVGRAQWWIEETDFENVKRGLVQKRKIWTDDPQGTQGLVFNMRKPPFDDIRMRQAFACLLNREKMISQLFYNEYEMLDSYFPGSVYENPDNPKYRYDPDRAVKLLAECGWSKRDQEGRLVNDKGEKLEFELTYEATSMERILTVFQEDLAKVGIKLNLKQSTGATMFKMVSERKFLIHWQAWGGLFFPNPENDVSSWTADPDNTNNLAGVKNDRIDELCKEYNVCFDQQRRVEIIREIDRIEMEIQPYALGWYAPFHRILYWNKFGHPDYYLARTSDWRSILSLWWVDPEKAKRLQEARKDKSIKLEVGPVDVPYWVEYDKAHGRQYTVKGL